MEDCAKEFMLSSVGRQVRSRAAKEEKRGGRAGREKKGIEKNEEFKF